MDKKVNQKLVTPLQQFKNFLVNHPKYTSLPINHALRSKENQLHSLLLQLQKAILAPPHPQNSQIQENSYFFQFIYMIQELIGAKDIDFHLRKIFQLHCDMLKSESSLVHMDLWIKSQKWNPDDFILDKTEPYYGFKSWSDFFTRKIKLQTRPINQNVNSICAPCQSYPLTSPKQPVKNIKVSDKFWLKNSTYSLCDMLGGKLSNDQLNKFVGGTIFQGYLDHWAYHRWHAPVSGTIEDIYTIPGFFFFLKPGTQKPNLQEFVSQQPFQSCTATRQVIIFNCDNEKIGKLIMIAISMAEVSTCVATVKVGERVQKGQQIGHFQLGSSYCLIFQKKCNINFSTQQYYYLEKGELASHKMLVNSTLAVVNSMQKAKL